PAGRARRRASAGPRPARTGGSRGYRTVGIQEAWAFSAAGAQYTARRLRAVTRNLAAQHGSKREFPPVRRMRAWPRMTRSNPSLPAALRQAAPRAPQALAAAPARAWAASAPAAPTA